MKKTLTARPWHETPVEEFMTSPVIVLDDTSTLRDAARTLTEAKISGAPVVDHRGQPVGVLSLFDITTYLAGLERPANEPGGFYRQGSLRFDMLDDEAPEFAPDEEVQVKDVMSPQILSVRPEAPLSNVAKRLRAENLHRVFVRNAKGELVGVVSTMDLLGALEKLS